MGSCGWGLSMTVEVASQSPPVIVSDAAAGVGVVARDVSAVEVHRTTVVVDAAAAGGGVAHDSSAVEVHGPTVGVDAATLLGTAIGY